MLGVSPQFEAWFMLAGGYLALALLAIGAALAHLPRWFPGPVMPAERRAAQQGLFARNLLPWLRMLIAVLAVAAAARLVLLAERPMHLQLHSRASANAPAGVVAESTWWCPAVDLGPAVDDLLQRLPSDADTWRLDSDANRTLLWNFVKRDLEEHSIRLPVVEEKTNPAIPPRENRRLPRWLVESLEVTLLQHLLSAHHVASVTIVTTPLPEVATPFDWSTVARILTRHDRPVIAPERQTAGSEAPIRYLVDPVYDPTRHELRWTLVLSNSVKRGQKVTLHLAAQRRGGPASTGRSQVERIGDKEVELDGNQIQSFTWKDSEMVSEIQADSQVAYYLLDDLETVRERVRFQASRLAIICGGKSQPNRWLQWREAMSHEHHRWGEKLGQELSRSSDDLPRFLDAEPTSPRAGETICHLDFDPATCCWAMATRRSELDAWLARSGIAFPPPSSIPAAYRASVDKTGSLAFAQSQEEAKGNSTIFSWDRQTLWEPGEAPRLLRTFSSQADKLVVAPAKYDDAQKKIAGRRPVVASEEPFSAIAVVPEGDQQVVVIGIGGPATDPWPLGFDRQAALVRSVVWGAHRLSAAATAPLATVPATPLQGSGALPLASVDAHRDLLRATRETYDFASLSVIGLYLALLGWRAASHLWDR